MRILFWIALIEEEYNQYSSLEGKLRENDEGFM